MQIPDKVIESATELDRASFERLREKRFRPPYDQYGLNLLRQMKTNELVLTQYYCGRAPYELLQNADDVHASQAVFVLLPEGLVFAHNGDWFSARNFISLADGWSDKDPNQCIGHKGLGFRSVLEITPSPHLVRLSPGAFFAVRFSRTLNQAHIDETLQRRPDLRAEVQEWTKNKQSVCPVMYIPTQVERHQLGACAVIYEALRRDTYGPAFTTMFWFPVDDPSSARIRNSPASNPIRAGGADQVNLTDWITGEVPVLLPFLRSIHRVAIYEGDSCLAETTTRETGQEVGLSEAVIEIRTAGQIQQRQFLLIRDNVPIPPQIKSEQGTPVALREMDAARIVLALRLNDNRPALTDRPKLHVYFPTEEASGFPFTVHADFQVKPDRTALVPGSHYNRWLFQQIASLAASEFLTQLLARFEAADALETLAPSGDPLAVSTKELVQAVIDALRIRREPFVPTRRGLLSPGVVIMPPEEDKDGFWDSHFAELLGELRADKQAFLLPEADRPQIRQLLRRIDMEQLPDATLLDLMEQTKKRSQTPKWWYECYSYLSRHRELSHWLPGKFTARSLIPLDDGTLSPVPGEEDRVVCLPSLAVGGERTPPRLFDRIFVWVNRDLATLILQGDSSVRSWLVDRLVLTPFEATQLLPRAVRKLAPRIFSGELEVTTLSLRRSWLFMKGVVDASKVSIGGDVFWQEIGRFPVVIQSSAPYHDMASLRPEHMTPAFLTFFPEEITVSPALRGVSGLPRTNPSFFRKLVTESGDAESQWVAFFRNAGMADAPKVFKYARVVQRSDDVIMSPEALKARRSKPYTGERQLDENEAVMDTLEADGLWSEYSSSSFCSHPASKVLHSLTAVQGLRQVTNLAQREWEAGEEAACRTRLWSLVEPLAAASASQEQDQVYCRGGTGGHTVQAERYIRRQLRRFRWLPTSLGPATIEESFFRRPGYSLISSGRQGDDFGDRILPYLVAEAADVLRLEQLGVEDLGSASVRRSQTLVRALDMIGKRLSSEWGQREVLSDRGRWRLVRGAIQEIYRTLNQRGDSLIWPNSLKLAVRGPEGPTFRTRPVFFADPGSPVEQAFMPYLPLIDVDRAYRDLFRSLGVVRLTPGETVNEQFGGEAEARTAHTLQREICERLAPYLLSVILAKSDRPEEREVILRRLSDRFEVKAAGKLKVSYALKERPTEEHTIDFPRFYMQRRVKPGTGAVLEAYFSLFIEGEPGTSIFDHQIDDDALGAALVPLFQDDAGDEIRSLFPRVVSRFCQTRGSAKEMSEFMHRQLGVSCEVLDTAQTLIADGGEVVSPPPSPPPVVLIERLDHEGGSTSAPLESLLDSQQDMIANAATKLVVTLRHVHTGQTIVSPGGNGDSVTAVQQDRGKRGEEEIKRRLEGPAGWAGYRLKQDRRNDGCGYDFLCQAGGSEVALEVKTFTENGSVNVTQKELQMAAQMEEHYHLLGVLDDGGPESCWRTFILPKPLRVLLQRGNFEIDAKLQVSADILFTDDRGVEGR